MRAQAPVGLIDPDALKASELFANLSDEERAELSSIMTYERHPKGSVLFRRMDRGNALYVLKEGSIEFTWVHPGGGPGRYETIGPGSFFGEVAVFSVEGRRTADAVAVTDAEVYALSRDRLTTFIRSRPEAAIHLLQGMAVRLARSGEQLQSAPIRNLNIVAEEKQTAADQLAKAVARLAGSLPFLAVHAVAFGCWIAYNVSVKAPRPPDPAPFHYLTLWVGLEAMALVCFVLMNQHRDDRYQYERNNQEFGVNVSAEKEARALRERMDTLEREVHAAIEPTKPHG